MRLLTIALIILLHNLFLCQFWFQSISLIIWRRFAAEFDLNITWAFSCREMIIIGVIIFQKRTNFRATLKIIECTNMFIIPLNILFLYLQFIIDAIIFLERSLWVKGLNLLTMTSRRSLRWWQWNIIRVMTFYGSFSSTLQSLFRFIILRFAIILWIYSGLLLLIQNLLSMAILRLMVRFLVFSFIRLDIRMYSCLLCSIEILL